MFLGVTHLIRTQLTFAKRTLSFGSNWAPTAMIWGTTGVLGALYAIQPRFLFKHLPLIGHNYLTAKDIEQMKAKEN
ncbi:hypothetical protein DLAC_01766 [Tieghemostelium lacteum]|uniref:Uncharacterized protein n=1 Tax=Tieghemostelium lacteum TaxID=361077 RepID=A0A152A692_TIELA|nr:hypothetical protein DLAC_01766 [Tieghemostelium lacteum]|eukprot:KYR01756.1 hypothetical protein DLAC_01766 [Tieghemostelium lacteum]